MNERIKELAEQANIEFTYDPTETPMRAFVECWEDDLEKFAELIVKECLAQVARVDNMLEDDPAQTAAVAWVASTIADHFGVES